MTVKKFLLLLFAFMSLSAEAQEEEEKSYMKIFGRVFLPSVEVGYQQPNSDLLQGALRLATSIEYRVRNNNDVFVRLNYDTYGARYNLQDRSTTNTIEGTVQFSDITIAPGYRLGDNTFRFVFSVMPGIKLYEFPTASIENQTIKIRQEHKSIFTTSFLTAIEFYFDEKSALTLSIFQNRVFEDVDFWENGRIGNGISLGFITSLL